MVFLWVVTLVWSFSFSLIGEFLAPTVDPYIAVSCRMLLALLLFLPWLLKAQTSAKLAFALIGLGAIQLGIMYLLLYHSFLYLSVAEVLLFTILTPLYVNLFDDLCQRKAWHWRWLSPALIAVAGAAVIRYQQVNPGFWHGFLLVQAANLCFAIGQVGYRQLRLGNWRQQGWHMGWFFVGAALVSFVASALFGNWQRLPSTPLEYGVLLWLGLVASGGGYWLWNAGARLVSASQLAVMNNMLIPAGLLVNLVLWQHPIHWPSFLVGSMVIFGSLWLARPPRIG